MKMLFIALHLFLLWPVTAAQHPQALTSIVGDVSPLIGTWEWRSGKDQLQITLRREQHFLAPDGKTYDVLLGKHRYTRNGVVMEESFSLGEQEFVLFSGYSNSSLLEMQYKDLSKNKTGRATLQFLPGGRGKASWRLQESLEAFSINRKIPPGFTVPKNVVLSRIK